jgi:hypothetical protein
VTRIRAGAARIRSAIAAPFGAARRWWDGFDSAEGQVATAGLVLLAGGLSLVWIPAALIVPGLVLVAIGMGFDLRRRGS